MITIDELMTLIESSGKNIPQIERDSGVAKSTMYSWRRGRRTPTVQHIEPVLNAIGFTLVLREITDDDD